MAAEQTITDLVAVVGVASPHECSDSVCARMDIEVPEGELHRLVHLKAMMDVGRFVFIKVPKATSPTASAAGGAAGRSIAVQVSASLQWAEISVHWLTQSRSHQVGRVK